MHHLELTSDILLHREHWNSLARNQDRDYRYIIPLRRIGLSCSESMDRRKLEMSWPHCNALTYVRTLGRIEDDLPTWWHLVTPSLSAWHLELNAVLLSSVRTNRVCNSYRLCSKLIILASLESSGTGSAGVPGCETLGLWVVEKESRWIKACLDARLLISRRPARSPLLKLPLPCLNSHKAESGDPVWKTSLTG